MLTAGYGTGCGAVSGEQPPLDGTSWTLTGWAEPDALPLEVTITAQFADGRVSGSAGVNRYSAMVTSATDGALSVQPVISTKMAGPPAATAAESAYLRRLQEATSYAVDGDTLRVADPDGQPSLTFGRD